MCRCGVDDTPVVVMSISLQTPDNTKSVYLFSSSLFRNSFSTVAKRKKKPFTKMMTRAYNSLPEIQI